VNLLSFSFLIGNCSPFDSRCAARGNSPGAIRVQSINSRAVPPSTSKRKGEARRRREQSAPTICLPAVPSSLERRRPTTQLPDLTRAIRNGNASRRRPDPRATGLAVVNTAVADDTTVSAAMGVGGGLNWQSRPRPAGCEGGVPGGADAASYRSTSMKSVKKLAIHPGIVVGMLQHYGKIPWNHLNHLKARFSWTRSD
jgi:hypothetical protein